MRFATRCVQGTTSRDPYNASAPPLYQTATFRQPSALEFGEYDYTRTANPTRTQVEEQIAVLEGARFACAYASGMAAVVAVTRLVRAGEEILAGDDLYGGTTRLLALVAPDLGIAVRYVDTTDLDAVARAFGPRTRLVLVETPTNPLLRIVDLRGLASIAKRHGALLAVDNSLLSPRLQRPLALGADLVVYSATKSLCGHGDVSAGAVVLDDPALHARLSFLRNAEGTGLSPFDCWLLLRGIKTLDVRVDRQNATAAGLAEALQAHPSVGRVYFPTLADPQSRAIHQSQASGPGSVLSFTTGDAQVSRRIVEGTRLFAIAVSFGSVASSISLPSAMSHASIPAALRDRLAPPQDLIRVSVGIEDPTDLVTDLRESIDRAVARPTATDHSPLAL